MKSGSIAACKRLKLEIRSFQEFWTTDFGFVSRDDRAVCVCVCSAVKTLFAGHQA